jgi:hypothetical protein
MTLTNRDKIYHITISDDKKIIKVTCIGIECVDTGLSPIYNSVSDLPDWAQGRLAVIAMLQVGELVTGVGGRISDNQYWIVPDTY